MNRKLPDEVKAVIKQHAPAICKARAALYKAQETMFKDVADLLDYHDNGGLLFEQFTLPDTDDTQKFSAAVARHVLRTELELDAESIKSDLQEIDTEEGS